MEQVKISAFVLTTNSIKNQFPVIESISSFLPVVDELIVIDGGSVDGTLEAIKAIGNDKIKIIQDDDTLWEENWCYCRMGKNFDRGLQECTGDWVIKFDADYILHENCIPKLRAEFNNASKRRSLCCSFTRLNFILADRNYVKTQKTFAVNKTLAKEVSINLHYGLDLKRWGFGWEFVDLTGEENGVRFGNLLRTRDNSFTSSATVCNYDYVFMTEDVAKESRFRHFRAEQNLRNLNYTKFEIQKELPEKNITTEVAWNKYIDQCKENLKRCYDKWSLDRHPKMIQDKLKNLKQTQQGYNCWGHSEIIAGYYE